jgi:hypothetical protein
LDLGKHIKKLLFLHDCVILQGLGGFVANYKPAEFDAVRNTAIPPSKQILFNHNLVHNDGLLYAHVSEATGYGYKDVEKMASAWIERVRGDTGRGMKFMIEGLGYFYLDTENIIQFREESGSNFLLESYGLPFLQYRELEGVRKTEVYRAHATAGDPLARQRRIRRWAYGTAAACLITALVIVPVRTGILNQAGIDIPSADSFRKEQVQKTGRTASAERTEASSISGETGSVGSHAGIAGQPGLSAEAARNIMLPDPEYHIVVGSFKDFGNARNLRNTLVQDGYQARILAGEKGFYRVSAGTYSSQAEAGGQLVAVRSEYQSAWILSN